MSIEIVFSRDALLGEGTFIVRTEKYTPRGRKQHFMAGYLMAYKIFPQRKSPFTVFAVSELAFVGSVMSFPVLATDAN